MTEEELLQQPEDAYMNEEQIAFFNRLLHQQREELQNHIDSAIKELRLYEFSSDPADLGSMEEQRQSHLRMLEREKKLLAKIDHSLHLLALGEYGWCEQTGEPIGLHRLLLRPTTTLSIEAKERQERLEKHQRKD